MRNSMYVYIENDEIKQGPGQLPSSWNNISNFFAVDVNELVLHGWYPYRFIDANPTDDDIIIGSNLEILENEVLERQIIRKKNETELQIELEKRWLSIRNERNKLLSESDWTQLPDSPLTPEKKIEWSSYRQQLRDVTSQLDPNNIIWPTKP
jgi:hypothetical protein